MNIIKDIWACCYGQSASHSKGSLGSCRKCRVARSCTWRSNSRTPFCTDLAFLIIRILLHNQLHNLHTQNQFKTKLNKYIIICMYVFKQYKTSLTNQTRASKNYLSLSSLMFAMRRRQSGKTLRIFKLIIYKECYCYIN